MLDFFLSPAYAQGTQPVSPMAQFLGGPGFIIVMLVVMYFMLIRPQMKRGKEQRQMLGALAKGDEVLTNGGMAGKLIAIGENYVTLEVADNIAVKVQKQAIASVLPKGTLKNL
ncbi:MAG TPA: preprotein translocase subunit YajC [Nevskiaceae bacterium]|nr:preprotein translocase subunit YajC [Nevskiaceae bacterium]